MTRATATRSVFSTLFVTVMLLLASGQTAFARARGVTVTRVSWAPPYVPCGADGTVTVTVDFRLDGTAMQANPTVDVIADLWDHDIFLPQLWWSAEDYLGFSRLTPTLQAPPAGTVRSVTKTFTIDVHCDGCTLCGLAGCSGESDPDCYVEVVDARTDELIPGGVSRKFEIPCVDTTVAWLDYVGSELDLLAIPEPAKVQVARAFGKLRVAKEPKAFLRLTGELQAIVKELSIPTEAKEDILDVISAQEELMKRRAEKEKK